jgi:Ca2+-binding RTX toxin-like protein
MGENSDQIYSGNRLIGVNYIDLGDGDNLLDLSGQSNSLAEEAMVIKVGSGQDTLWLSDGHENVDTGAGNDNIIVNGGIDRITTGDDNDIITIADNIGNLTITDFDPNKDKLVFSTSEDKVSMVGELITVNNTLGDYVITLTGNILSDLTSEAFSFI